MIKKKVLEFIKLNFNIILLVVIVVVGLIIGIIILPQKDCFYSAIEDSTKCLDFPIYMNYAP